MRRAATWLFIRLVCLVCLLVTPPARLVSADEANDLNTRGIHAAQAGDFESGVADLRRALALRPSDDVVRRNLSGMLTDWARLLDPQGHTDHAVSALQEAVQYDPENAAAWVTLGDIAYFRRSDFTQAIAYWKQAYGRLAPDERRSMADRIAQAQRDATIEHAFEAYRTTHFDIRAPQGDEASLTALGQVLEAAYRDVYTVFGRGPSHVTVIVYDERDLHRTYYQRDWALGFYDGRLRILKQEVGSEALRVLVRHELAHAFMRDLFGDAVPTWVHEGFAQVQEGERPRAPQELEAEEAVRRGTAWVPLKWLDRRFKQPPSRDDVGRAYVEARLVVEELLRRHGTKRFVTFLGLMANGSPVDAAFDHAFAPDRWASTDRNMTAPSP